MKQNQSNTPPEKERKILIMHDCFDIKGGGEKLILTLRDGLSADLCYGFYRDDTFDIARVDGEHFDLQAYTRFLGLRSIKLMRAFSKKTKFLSSYNCIIYSGLISHMGLKNAQVGSTNIVYCHSLPRFVYDLKDYYLTQAKWWQRPILRWLIHYVKPRYEKSLSQMDIIIANSKNVQGRLYKYLRRDSIVVYPPIDTKSFHWIEQGDYYLSSARVEKYKRVETIVRAFMLMPDKKLIVGSSGRDKRRLQKLAANYPNISFAHSTDEKSWQELIGRVIATIYIPIDEDFGMTPVESMAAGKPVIGSAEGGLLETVIDGKTGLLVKEVTAQSIQQAVNTMTLEFAASLRTNCEMQARKFSQDIFLSQMKKVIESV